MGDRLGGVGGGARLIPRNDGRMDYFRFCRLMFERDRQGVGNLMNVVEEEGDPHRGDGGAAHCPQGAAQNF